MNVKRYLKHYFYGLFAQCWNGAWTAAEAAFGLGVGSVFIDSIDAKTWCLGVLAVFGTTFVRRALQYFATNKLPEKLDATRPPMPLEGVDRRQP